MKSCIIFLFLIVITFSLKKEDLISNLKVNSIEKLVVKLENENDESYKKEIDKLEIPSEIKKWAKNADLEEKKVKKKNVDVNYNINKGGNAKGEFAVIGVAGKKKKKKIIFKYGTAECKLKPLNNEDIDEDRIKRFATRILKREIEKKIYEKYGSVEKKRKMLSDKKKQKEIEKKKKKSKKDEKKKEKTEKKELSKKSKKDRTEKKKKQKKKRRDDDDDDDDDDL